MENIEEKVLGRPIGGVSEVDGDGDNFVTGPDGEDNIPAPAKAESVYKSALDSIKKLEKSLSKKYGDIRNPENAEKAMRTVFPNLVKDKKFNTMFPVKNEDGSTKIRPVDVGRLAMMLRAGEQDPEIAGKLMSVGVSGKLVQSMFGANYIGVFAHGVGTGTAKDVPPFVAAIDFGVSHEDPPQVENHAWSLKAVADLRKSGVPQEDLQYFYGAYLAAHEFGHARHIIRMYEHAGIDIRANTNEKIEENVRKMADASGLNPDLMINSAKGYASLMLTEDQLKEMSDEDQYRYGLVTMMLQAQTAFYARLESQHMWDDLNEKEKTSIADRGEWSKVSGYASANGLEFVAEMLSMNTMGVSGYEPNGWDKMASWLNAKQKQDTKIIVKKIDTLSDELNGTWIAGCDGLVKGGTQTKSDVEIKYPGEFILGVARNAIRRRRRKRKRIIFKTTGLDPNASVHDYFYIQSNTIHGKSASPYTNNALRERLKNRIMAGSEGGRPGQWSARKAQLLAVRYRAAGGGYKKGKKPTKTQRSLRKWTREKWRTSDGKPALRDGKMRRYLPDKVWGRLTPAQRDATNRKKIEGDKRGRQFVPNTEVARKKGKAYRNRTR